MRRFFKWLWRKRYRRWMSIGAAGFLVLSVVGVEMTSRSSFCNSCHIMNSYYASWQVSPHKDIECTQCHIAPGMANLVSAKLNGLGQVVDDVLHRTSTKPSASVSDISCTRAGCHNLEDVKKIARREGPFFFEHAKHLNLTDEDDLGIQIHCTTCHSHFRGSEHFEVNTAVCVTCHLMPGGPPRPPRPVPEVELAAATQPETAPALPALYAAPVPVSGQDDSALANGEKKVSSAMAKFAAPNHCESCHQPPAEPIEYRGLKVVHAEYLAYNAACESCHRNVTAAPEPIDDDKCYACHDFARERNGDVVQLHRVHTIGRHKVECFSCHGLTSHGPEAQVMALERIDCRACHRNQHEIQQATYESAPPAAAAPLPSPHTQPDGATAVTPMFLAHVDCTGCHIQPQALSVKPGTGATVAKAVPSACDHCHKSGLGEQLVPQWQRDTRRLYERAVAMLPATPPPAGSSAEKLVRDARQLLDLVRLDGSWGVHNPRYTQGLIAQAMHKLEQAAGGAGASASQPEVQR